MLRVLKLFFASAKLLKKEKAERLKKFLFVKPPKHSKISTKKSLTTSSSLTNLFGQSERAKPQPAKTQTTQSKSFVTLWQNFIALNAQRKEFVFNTAAA